MAAATASGTPDASSPPAPGAKAGGIIGRPGWEAPVYFLSDLHLNAPAGPRTNPVLRFLRAREGEAAAVYLVGDIFDFWIGHRTAIYAAYLPFLNQLQRLVQAGTRVVIFSGNHDPDPGPRLADFGLEVHEGPLTERIGGRTVRMEHGDLIDPRGWHRRLPCHLARSQPARAVARRVHPDLLWRMASRYAGRDGGGPGEYRRPLPAGLKTTAFERHRAQGIDVWVLGHYHRAVVHPVAGPDGRPQTLFVLGDWVAHRSYLKVFQGEFTLMRDHGEAPATSIPPGDHGPER